MKKNIYCPICKRIKLTIHGNSTFKSMATCRKCNISITYDPATKKLTKGKYPERDTSAGMTFY